MKETFNCSFYISSNHQLPQTYLFCIYLTLRLTSDDDKATENFAESYDMLIIWKLTTETKKYYVLIMNDYWKPAQEKTKHNIPS